MHSPLFSDLVFDDSATKQAQLYQYLVNRIMRGSLTPGSKLPSTRTLAESLNIGRNTVISALEQLISEGFLTSQVGKGTFVNGDLPTGLTKLKRVSWQPKFSNPPLSEFGKRIRHESVGDEKHSLPFTPGIPDLRAFPHKLWSKLSRRHQHRIRLQAYDGSLGYLPLRKSVAEYLALSRGVSCEPDQIIITQGAQQAIYLCCLVLLNAGDDVLMECPGYRNAYRAFKAAGANIRPVAVDHQGMNISALPSRTDNPVKLLYCTPTHQYPLGGILPAAKRIELLDWAASNNTWLIEDDYDSEFHFHGRPINALQGMAEQTPVLYIGSFSKTLFTALRTGYLVVPKHLVVPFAKAKMYIGGETPLLNQAIIADFINDGHFVTHLRKMRNLYEEKWQHTRQLVTDKLGDQVSIIAQSAGMHLTLSIPDIDDLAVQNQFARAGFGSTALSSYYFEQRGKVDSGLILGFSNTSSNERIQGISTLTQLIAA